MERGADRATKVEIYSKYTCKYTPKICLSTCNVRGNRRSVEQEIGQPIDGLKIFLKGGREGGKSQSKV